MRIRAKIILVVLPLIITPLVLIAHRLVLRRAQRHHPRGHRVPRASRPTSWPRTPTASGRCSRRTASRAGPSSSRSPASAVASFARSMIRSDNELILALDSRRRAWPCPPGRSPLAPRSWHALAALAGRRAAGWQRGPHRRGRARGPGGARSIRSAGTSLITVERDAFYQATNQILEQSVVILAAAALLASVLLLLLFSGYLTRPAALGGARPCGGSSPSGDLSRRVHLTYRDETGDLAPRLQPHDRGAGAGLQRDQGLRPRVGHRQAQRAEDPHRLPEVRAQGSHRHVHPQPREHAEGREPRCSR